MDSYPDARPVGQFPKSSSCWTVTKESVTHEFIQVDSYPRAHNSGQLHKAHSGGQLPKSTSW